MTLLASCHKEEVTPREKGTGRVYAISRKTDNPNGQCIYYLELLVPYLPPSVNKFEDQCGKYHEGDTIRNI